MNKRGMFKYFVIVILIIIVYLLYFHTSETKEIAGMLAAKWDPLAFDFDNRTVNLKLANATEIAHAVVLDAAEKAEQIDGESIAESLLEE